MEAVDTEVSDPNITIHTEEKEGDVQNRDDENNSHASMKNFFKSFCFTIGSTVGSGIFATPGAVCHYAGNPLISLLVWLSIGFISRIGAILYSELMHSACCCHSKIKNCNGPCCIHNPDCEHENSCCLHKRCHQDHPNCCIHSDLYSCNKMLCCIHSHTHEFKRCCIHIDSDNGNTICGYQDGQNPPGDNQCCLHKTEECDDDHCCLHRIRKCLGECCLHFNRDPPCTFEACCYHTKNCVSKRKDKCCIHYKFSNCKSDKCCHQANRGNCSNTNCHLHFKTCSRVTCCIHSHWNNYCIREKAQCGAGEYRFLNDSFGYVSAYLYAWCTAVILRPSVLAANGIILTQCLMKLLNVSSETLSYAIFFTIMVLLLGLLFIYSRLGNAIVYISGFISIIGLLVISCFGLIKGWSTKNFNNLFHFEVTSTWSTHTATMLLSHVLYSYNGWKLVTSCNVEMAVKKINKSLAAGIIVVVFLYVFFNFSFLLVMINEELSAIEIGAINFIEITFGNVIAQSISLLVVILASFSSCLGLLYSSKEISKQSLEGGVWPSKMKVYDCFPIAVATVIVACINFKFSDYFTLISYHQIFSWITYTFVVVGLLIHRMKYFSKVSGHYRIISFVGPSTFIVFGLIFLGIALDSKFPPGYSWTIIGGIVFFIFFHLLEIKNKWFQQTRRQRFDPIVYYQVVDDN